jgi:hypothetical protein
VQEDRATAMTDLPGVEAGDHGELVLLGEVPQPLGGVGVAGGQVRHRGGAIFLHVNGSGATAGCASAPRWFMRRVMNRLDQDRVPVIAIGR